MTLEQQVLSQSDSFIFSYPSMHAHCATSQRFGTRNVLATDVTLLPWWREGRHYVNWQMGSQMGAPIPSEF